MVCPITQGDTTIKHRHSEIPCRDQHDPVLSLQLQLEDNNYCNLKLQDAQDSDFQVPSRIICKVSVEEIGSRESGDRRIRDVSVFQAFIVTQFQYLLNSLKTT